MRLAYRVAYRCIQGWTFVRRPSVDGTMIAVCDGRRVLLVRHTYGDRRRWDLPGGWLHAGEDPAVAAHREMREEVGLDVPVRPLVELEVDEDFKHEHLWSFAADWPGGRWAYDPVEIAEVAWFDAGDVPPGCGAGTQAVLRALAEG